MKREFVLAAARQIPAVAAILVVLAAYAFFASGGTFDFPRLGDPGESNYASLAAGFARGQLHLTQEPVPELVALPYPWDYEARAGIWYLWDVSYFNGRYYLYFSPLPALLFYLPLGWLRDGYPPDTLATAFFSAWAFLACVAFVHRALRTSGHSPLVAFALWILLIGVGNVIPFVLITPGTYAVPSAAGMAMTSMWALAMVPVVTSPTAANSGWMSLWLALAIAARPNLGVLLLPALVAVATTRPARAAVRRLAAFAVPLIVIGGALAWYNFARFGSPFEFGVRYQLTLVSMFEARVCGVSDVRELIRLANHLLHYVFWSPAVTSGFPFVEALPARLDRAVTWPAPDALTEQAIGMAPLIPLTVVGTIAAILLIARRSGADAGTRSAILVMAGGWLVLFGVSSCWWVVARYSLDFMLLIIAPSVICIESALRSLDRHSIRILPLQIGIGMLATYSVLLGILLGFAGPGDAFRRLYPEMFERLAGWLG